MSVLINHLRPFLVDANLRFLSLVRQKRDEYEILPQTLPLIITASFVSESFCEHPNLRESRRQRLISISINTF